MENDKRTIKQGKRKVRWDRLFGVAGLAVALIAGGTIGGNKILDKNKDIPKLIEQTIDSDGIEYQSENIITLYEKKDDDSMNRIGLMLKGEKFKIYTDRILIDENDNQYYYCNSSFANKVGFVRADELMQAKRIDITKESFDSIYHIKDDFDKDYIEMYSAFMKRDKEEFGTIIYKGKNVFVDKSKELKDDEGYIWYRAKNSDGDIGYIRCDDKVEEVTKGRLMKVNANDKELAKSNDKYSNINDYIDNLENGDRIVLIGDGEEKGLHYAVYFDSDGEKKIGQIEKDLLKDIDFKKEGKLSQPEKEEINNTFNKDSVYEWHKNPNNGIKGIDISGMTSKYLEKLLTSEEPDIEYGVIRIGASGYGNETRPYENKLLPYESSANVTFDKDTFELKKDQIDILKKHNKTVMAYFYATDVTMEEADEIVNQIEKSIDMLGGNIEPIIDCEMHNEGYDERMCWINSPFLDEYNETNGTKLDFSLYKTQWANIDMMKNHEDGSYTNEKSNAILNFELKMNEMIDKNPEVQDFISYCQDKKAQNIAHMYSRLYKDGYLSGKNAILYSGTKAVSKDSLKATITGDYGSEFQKVAYFRMDDVNKYLSDPNSESYIPDFYLGLWLADYTGNENFKRFDEYAISNQTRGDIILDYTDEYASKYDKNIMCKEFYMQMKQQIDDKNKMINIENIEDEDIEK